MLNQIFHALARGFSRGNSNSKHSLRYEAGASRLAGALCAFLAAAGALLSAYTIPAQGFGLSRDFNKPGNITL